MDYANDTHELISSTFSTHPSEYGDWLTDEIMEWVRFTTRDEDAVSNLKIIINEYERRKTFKQKLLSLML